MTNSTTALFPAKSVKGTTISATLDGLLDHRSQTSWPVSLALTALALRQQVPGCDLTDRNLADLIAIRAIERGQNVIFDADLLDTSG